MFKKTQVLLLKTWSLNFGTPLAHFQKLYFYQYVYHAIFARLPKIKHLLILFVYF